MPPVLTSAAARPTPSRPATRRVPLTARRHSDQAATLDRLRTADGPTPIVAAFQSSV